MDWSFPSVEGFSSALASTLTSRRSLATSAISRGAGNLQDGRRTEALADFRRATAFDPSNTTAHRLLASTFAALGRTDEAISAYRQALEVDPGFVDARNDLAKLYMTSGRWAEAELEFRRVIATDAGATGAVASLGYIAMSTERLDEAEAHFQKAARMAPGDAAARYSLGLVHARMGRHDEAVVEFDEAIRLRPGYAAAFADKAYSLVELDQPELARTQVEALLDLGTEESVSLAVTVARAIERPKIAFFDITRSTFNPLFGAGTAVSSLDPALATPGAVVTLTMTFEFNTEMDMGSVQNPYNWSISRATGGPAGTYNNGTDIPRDRQVAILPLPVKVTYDPVNKRATVYFKVSQNAAGNGVMDPAHWVFRFSGVDGSGRAMDTRGDEFSWSMKRAF